MDGYLRAWRSNAVDDVAALFTNDAEYLTAPFVSPRVGHQQIIDGWIADRDEPDGFEFKWHPLVVHEDLGVIEGETRYRDGPVYSNLWVMRFSDDGRCRHYTEWYMDQATSPG